MAERDLIQQLDQAISAMLVNSNVGRIGLEVTELMRVAQFVRELPDQDFRTRLKQDLMKEKNTMTPTMTPTTTAAFKPEGFRSLTPYLLAPSSAGLLNFMKDVFGATEIMQVPRPDGSIMHAEVMVGDSVIEMGENPPQPYGARPTPLHVYVPDVDAMYARALAAGATSLGDVVDHEYGERSGSVRDASGNHWYIATAHGQHHIPAGLHSVNLALLPRGAAEFIEFLKRAFGAEEAMRHEVEGVIVHARMKIGDAVLEMGEAHGKWQPMPCAIHLYVPDTDAVFRQALAAGATSVTAPMDAPYGDRTATVNDPQGNQWYIATRLQK